MKSFGILKLSSILIFTLLLFSACTQVKYLYSVGSPNIYTACLDCDASKVEDMLREHYADKFAELDLPEVNTCNEQPNACAPGEMDRVLLLDNWIVFTDLGDNKGLKYSGLLRENGQIMVFASFITSSVDLNYWLDMSALRALLISSRIAIEAGLAEMSGSTKAQSLQNKLNYKDDENGSCVGNTLVSSAVDYFNGSSRATVDSALRAQLDNYIPEINAQVSEVNKGVGASNSGVSATLGVTIAFRAEFGSLTSSFSNGYLVFILEQNSGGFFIPTLNLFWSVIGQGISHSSGFALTNVPLSSYFHAIPGGWAVNPNLDISITDPCLSEDWEEAIYEEIVYDNEGSGIDMDNNGWQGCFNPQVLEMTHRITWDTYTTRIHRRRNGTLVMVLVVDHHSMALPNDNDTSEYNRICF